MPRNSFKYQVQPEKSAHPMLGVCKHPVEIWAGMAKSMTARQIAEAYGVTRNAVIGALNRHKRNVKSQLNQKRKR